MNGAVGLATGILLAVSASTLNAEPHQPAPEKQIKVNHVLAKARTLEAISIRVGIGPDGCIRSSNSMFLCEWGLTKRQAGWRALADAIATAERIALLCELPSDGSLRANDSCSARPRHSNRGMFRPKTDSGKKRVKSRYPRKEYEVLAQSWLDEARTLVELSRLIGAIPGACMPIPAAAQICTWHTNNKTYGHGTVAMSMDAKFGNKVLFACTLPTDGSRRAPNSCHSSPES